MVKKKILIKGRKVHDVGYRLFLMNLADDIGIENFDAKNIKKDDKQCVKVLVESSEENITEFFNYVEKKENFPKNSCVDSVDMEEYTGYVKPLESFTSGFMAYQQQKFANAGVGLLKVQEGTLTEMKGTKYELHKFRTESCEKQDQTISEIKTVGGKVDNLTTATQDNFNTLDIKYDVISQAMNRIFEELVEERKESRKSMEKLVNAILQSKQ